MNMQAMMQQAQKMQKEMMSAKGEVENKVFKGRASLVAVEVNGKKEVLKVEIAKDIELGKEDIETLEDMVLVAINSALKEADKEMEEKMGSINPGLKGLL